MGGDGDYYTYRYTVTTSHFNISLIVRDKLTRQCPQTTIFEEKGEPKRIRTEVPLLTARPNQLTRHGHGLLEVYTDADRVSLRHMQRPETLLTHFRVLLLGTADKCLEPKVTARSHLDVSPIGRETLINLTTCVSEHI